MPCVIANNKPFNVAIIGGGIIGVVLALGLMKRNINVKIYEQARSFREIGAGIAFTANAIRCMSMLDPQIVDALKRAATLNGDSKNSNHYLHWFDGYNHDSTNDTDKKLLFKLYAEGFEACHRAHFLDELIKVVPEAVVEFKKRFDTYIDRGDNEKLLLKFCDGTTAEADAVIGCDGIKSRVRELLLGEGNPASYPHFSHKVAFRCLIPLDQAEAVLGTYIARSWNMHIGPDGHILHFPVANQALMNVVAFITDPQDWTNDQIMTAPATKAEVIEAFASWCPTVHALINLLPNELNKWAIFDTHDYPAPTYMRSRVCIAGDAAHASSPHLGAGAVIGVEDALALATLIEMAMSALQSTHIGNAKVLSAAFDTFDTVRRERSQWLVHSSRYVCKTFEWANPETGSDPEKCFKEITSRFHRIWDFDVEGMLREVAEEYKRRLTV